MPGKRGKKRNEGMQKVIAREKIKREDSLTWDVHSEHRTRWKQRDAGREERLGWASRQTCR